MEQAAKGILLPGLIVGSPTLLSPSDQLQLASWATLLAMEYDLAHTSQRRIPFFRFSDRNFLRTTKQPPQHTRVWIGKHNAREMLAWACDSEAGAQIRFKDATIAGRGYVLTFTIGLLVFQVHSHRLPPYHGIIIDPQPRFIPSTPGVFEQIWPVRGSLNYNPSQAFADEELMFLSTRWTQEGSAPPTSHPGTT
ncbi:MAG: hypothetical protein ACLP36_12225 [Acidimicrobiales bacterium]